ncbi:hypothetical protein AB0H36_07120 [Kribbella sp. NPDC050820]|uniref:hypothetical protein n=1 Tax=Kribbella sp. NPDC050820 TaxID=3155408 RepID=UPI0033DA6B39
MKPISAAMARPPWQNRQRLRQAGFVAGGLLFLYAVLVLIALLGGPRIGAAFLPLPGGGPEPANPVAGLEPSSRVPTSGPSVPRGSETPVPTQPPTPGETPPLPSTTTTTAPAVVTTEGQPATPRPTPKPTPELVDHQEPTQPPATKLPPKPTTTTTTGDPTTQPTEPPTTTDPPPTTPTNPPTTPDDPEDPDPPTLGGVLTAILDTLGL